MASEEEKEEEDLIWWSRLAGRPISSKMMYRTGKGVNFEVVKYLCEKWDMNGIGSVGAI